MWDLLGSVIEPVSLALAGGFFTAEPPGKTLEGHFYFPDKKESFTTSMTTELALVWTLTQDWALECSMA